VPAAVVAHGQAVARAARGLGQALVAAGNSLDLDLLEAAARCHDLAKGQPDHAQAGAAILRDWGWPRVAELVARHADIDPPQEGPVGADEVLYLADKLVEGDQPVDLDQRFQAKLARHGGDPGAVIAIERRWSAARAIRARIAAVCERDQAAAG
ncbi:MAG: HD domain-containing protein, partial [Desulfarculus sp.]|nr:HD domain-containing protein [Desulfarculus sp.]